MVDNISENIKVSGGKQSRSCDACRKYKISHQFYIWNSMLTDKFLGLVCSLCAYKEGFGGNYKRNKKYIEWKEDK
tara:strand:+ start:1996 stop:2220 length:225 start_codon:yes stop_codon:yes gene_type:complete